MYHAILQARAAEREVEIHRALSAAKTTNVLPLLDSGRVSAGAHADYFLLFPLMRAGNLRGEIDQRLVYRKVSPWSTERVLALFAGVCKGLQALHTQTPPLAHRDIKPENVLVGNNGEPLLMDFGSVAEANVSVRSRKEAMMLQVFIFK